MRATVRLSIYDVTRRSLATATLYMGCPVHTHLSETTIMLGSLELRNLQLRVYAADEVATNTNMSTVMADSLKN